MAKRKHETNTERLTRLMENSHCGPIMQGFIMNAILEQARAVKMHMDANPDLMNADWIVNPKAWHACAAEIVATWYTAWEEVSKTANGIKAANGEVRHE